MIAENILILRNQIKDIAEKNNRKVDDIILLAVTKTHPPETIENALKNGIDFIAENKVQEAEEKIPNLHVPYREFHFIGHLQSNKINKLMTLKPALIHSIDKYSTAKKLNKYCEKQNLVQPILIQINTSQEESKFGIEPDKTLAFIRQFESLKNVKIKGLMTIGKWTDNQAEIRACFKLLRTLFEELKQHNLPFAEMQHLSMGMTNDFAIALEEGSTIIRIGSAIFGERDYRR